ncbi:MAG: hypothetical protein U0905_09065 [Pirellulales bacterium]
MRLKRFYPWAFLPLAMGMMVGLGCDPKGVSTPSAGQQASTSLKTSDAPLPPLQEGNDSTVAEHGHKPGEHGGIMVSLGRDSYHIEAVIAADGTVRLYTLGKDETRVIDIERQSLKGFIKAIGDTESNEILFEAQPQDGDQANRTSLFVGKLPAEYVGKSVEVTVPNVRIDGERFRLGFQTPALDHGGVAMPAKLADDAERDLYLKPGGRYTEADIQANGNTTATLKFKGIKSSHDMHPKAGDRICPITETKANPKFTWIVDGKSYEFCCPPCVDEFVKMAKGSSDPLPSPESFVKAK